MKTFQKIAIIVIVLLFCIQQSTYAQDTLSVTKPVKHRFSAEPLRATMLAIAFPGLGQVYNRKYWKIPLVYAGFGAVVYSISFNSKNFNLYMKAYQDFTDAIPETKSYQKLILADPKTYDPSVNPNADRAITQNYKDAMLRMVDYYKRYRDLSYIGVGAWYLISILDANVDASLFNYDVTPNLDITVFPVQVPLPGGFAGAGINLGMKITF